jgi:hypothetical protein
VGETTHRAGEAGWVVSPKRARDFLRTVVRTTSGDKEDKVAVAMVVDNPQGSQEIYERIRDVIGLDRPAGGICHLAGPGPDGGWRVIEVWESEQDARRFVEERVLPAAEAVGAPAPPAPQIWQLHNCMT